METLKKLILFYLSDKQFRTFFIIGVSNTLLNILIYESLVTFFPYQISFSLSYLIGFSISYFFNTKLTYKSSLSLDKGIKFFAASFIGFCIGLGINRLGVHFLGISERNIFFITTAILLNYNFFIGKRILEK